MKKWMALLIVAGFAGQTLAVDPAVGRDRGYGDSPRWITPSGAQRGSEVTVTVSGHRLADTEEILWYRPGIEVLKIEEAKDRSFQAKLRIAKDCALGEHPFRVRTRTGVSIVRTFNVGPFPNGAEKEPNNEFSQANPVEGNVTVEGRVDSEDLDYFAIQAKKGQRIGAEVEGIRLNMTLFDPYVAIMADDGSILAESDDTALHLQDPAVTAIAPKDGTYYVQVRETSYGGGRYAYYRAHVGHFSRPLAVYPPGGPAGEKVKVKFLGDAAGDFEQEVQLPGEATEHHGVVAVRDGISAPSPNAFRVSPFGNVLEAEPNNDFKTATAAKAPLPAAFNGIIEEKGDVDCFRFTAKKGQSFHARVHAKSVSSELDPVMNIYNEKGGRVTGNDDSGGHDSYVRFNVPADGDYFVRINDHLGRGGKVFTYRVEFTPYEKSYDMSIPHVARRDSQSRQAMVVPQGNRFATMMTAVRRNGLRGDLKFVVPGLPKGVKLVADVMPGNVSTFPLIFEAAADAPIGAALVEPKVVNIVDGKEVPVPIGGLRQQIDLVHSNPNSTVYKKTELDGLVVAVTEKSPFTIKLHQPKAPIAQYGSMNLKVEIEKAEGWDETVYVYLPYRPPGVSGYSRIAIGKGKNTGNYPINARYNARTEDWKICVNGFAKVDNGNLWQSSDFVDLEVVPRFVLGKFQTTTVNPGEEVKVVCKLDQKEAFEGKAELKLYSLPPHASAETIEITKDTQEAVFTVKTSEKTPLGAYKRLYCKINFDQNGEPIDHMVATSGRLIVAQPKEIADQKDKKDVALAK